MLIFALLSVVSAAPTYTIVQNAVTMPQLSTLISVLTTPGYESILNALNSPGTYTLFAPTNNAFAMSTVNPGNVSGTSEILYYHVLGSILLSAAVNPIAIPHTLANNPMYVNLGRRVGQVVDVLNGATLTVGSGVPGNSASTANIIQADIICGNGVIQVIDTVLPFPLPASQTALIANCNTFYQAINQSGLLATIDGIANLTIFAPNDAAFTAAGIDLNTIDPTNLTNILTYHVVLSIPGVGYTTNLNNGEMLTTLQGGMLTIQLIPGVQVVGASNSANVVVPNSITMNGVLQVIDTVLMPPSMLSLRK